MKKSCQECGGATQRWGKTAKGTPRFYCPICKKTATWARKDAVRRHRLQEMDLWLSGKDNLSEIAGRMRKTRQAMWKEFHSFFDVVPEPKIPQDLKPRILVVDGTYVHGHILCAMIAIDEHDNLFWKFAPYESYASWHAFLSQFPQPEAVVMDGQKGLFSAVKMMWPSTKIQRCQFHVVQFAIQYLGRKPKDEAGQALLKILYTLKEAKTPEARDRWIMFYKFWEKIYEKALGGKNESGRFQNPRLRSTRLIIRRALPNLFTFLDIPGCPNTTNLVEGWVNGALAEALRWHRGLRLHEKKALVSIVLSHLSRGGRINNLKIPRAWLAIKSAQMFPRIKEESSMLLPVLTEHRVPILGFEGEVEKSEIPF